MRKMMTALLTCCLAGILLTNTSPCHAQTKIAAADLKSDFRMLRDTLLQLHPSLYWYKTREQMTHVFDSCEASIRDSMTTAEFYRPVIYTITAIGDGHANCRLPRDLMNDLVANSRIFPAIVLFLQNHAYVLCNSQDSALTGSEILSVNGRPMSAIIRQYFGYVPSDGSIQTRKNWELCEQFPILFHVVDGAKEHYDITCKTRTGEIRSATLQADLLKNFRCPTPFQRPARYLGLTYMGVDSQIAVLSIRTFFDGFLERTGENFKTFLDSAFRDIHAKGIHRMIVDVRNNQGGQDVNGSLLYSYLAQKPFAYYSSLETTKGRLPASIHPNLSIQQPHANNYSGEVCFLIDGRSFSAAAEFAAIARSNDRGPFVGEETGGGYYGNTSGGDITLTLPHSGLSCRIPLTRYTLAVKPAAEPDRGILPDHAVYLTIDDIIGHKDPQLEFAITLYTSSPGHKSSAPSNAPPLR